MRVREQPRLKEDTDMIPQTVQERINLLEAERQALLQEPYTKDTFQAYQSSLERAERLRSIKHALEHLFAEKRQMLAEQHGIQRYDKEYSGWEQH